jgi:hypothetical protein
VVEDTLVGRIYREMILGNRSAGDSGSRSLKAGPREVDSAVQSGVADTSDEEKAAFAKRYGEVKRGRK